MFALELMFPFLQVPLIASSSKSGTNEEGDFCANLLGDDVSRRRLLGDELSRVRRMHPQESNFNDVGRRRPPVS